MNRVIWKYVLELTDEQKVEMPSGALILSFQRQGDNLCVWCLIDLSIPKVYRTLRIHGTGHQNIESHERHVASIQDGSFVWHLFDCGEF